MVSKSISILIIVFGTSSGFGTILLPKPQEVPKKKQNQNCQNLKGYQKIKKKNDDFPIFRPGASQWLKIFGLLVFLIHFQVLACFGFFGTYSDCGTILLPNPEEVPKKTKPELPKPESVPTNSKKQRFSYLQAWGQPMAENLCFFCVFLVCFFGTLSRFDKQFLVLLVPFQVLAVFSCPNLKRYQKRPKQD